MIDKLRVKAVAFQDEGGIWIVQGVEYDICVHGESLSAARKAFERALIESCMISRHLGKEPMQDFPAAPHRFHEMFEEAEDEIQQVKAQEPSAPPITMRLANAA